VLYVKAFVHVNNVSLILYSLLLYAVAAAPLRGLVSQEISTVAAAPVRGLRQQADVSAAG